MKERILLLSDSYSPTYGWGTVGYYFREGLKKRFNVIDISAKDSKGLKPYYGDWLNKFYGLLFPITSFFYYFKIRKQLKEVNYVVSTAETFLPLLYYIKKFNKNKKTIFISYGTYAYIPFVRAPGKWINPRMLRSCDIVLNSSTYSLNKMKEHYKGDVKLLKLGVDSKKYHPVKGVKKEEAFVFVGIQKARKGVAFLIDAMELLVKKHPDVKLYFVGPMSQEYVNIVNEKKLDKNILFCGKVSHEELLKYFSKSLCHILPSINYEDSFEGFGLVHLEANACGIPSIGSKGSSNDDVIKDGVSGYLITQRDTKDLYEKMLIMVENKELYRKMAKASIPYAKAYSWEKCAKELIRIINKDKKAI